MKKKKILTLILFAPLALAAQVQHTHEYSRLRWGIEVGFEAFSGDAITIPQIRESRSGYYGPEYISDFDLYYCGFMFPKYDYTRYFVGFKPEYSLNHHFAVAAGLRFAYNNSVFNSDRDYFLWKVKEEGLTTNYVRVTSVTQNNFYVGIPLELKIFTSRSDLRVRQYFKTGFVFNALVTSDLNVNFEDAAMAKYGEQISRQVKKPARFGAQAIFGVGLKLGRMNHPFGNIEFQIPVNLLNKQRASSFIYQPSVSFAMVATINIPAGKQKLSYNYYSAQ
ncbi:MAG: outer membrane beta-barrel protein [Prevotellaceae bacterium]|jgi:hypothetical protein|nr:outer membrane beta-barrel protein [Prevotellaceae bacterium]